MAFFKKSKNQNFDVFSGYAWHAEAYNEGE